MARRKISIYLILSAIYMGLIFYLSSYPMEMKVPTFSGWDKVVHAVVYGILAAMVYLGLQEMEVGGPYLILVAFGISFFYGIFNEIHQYFVPWREADVLDVMANGIGALCFPLGLSLRTHNKK